MGSISNSIIDAARPQPPEDSLQKLLLQSGGIGAANFKCHSTCLDSCSQVYVEAQSEDEESFWCLGYKRSLMKSIVYVMTVVISAGFVLLLSYWKPNLRCKLKYKRCAIIFADLVLVKTEDGDSYEIPLEVNETHLNNDAPCRSDYSTSISSPMHENGDVLVGIDAEGPYNDTNLLIEVGAKESSSKQSNEGSSNQSFDLLVKILQGSIVVSFMFKNIRYVWSPEVPSNEDPIRVKCAISALAPFDAFLTFSDIKTAAQRVLQLDPTECVAPYQSAAFDKRQNRQRFYGSNTMCVPVKSYLRLLIEEVFNPFYCFQIASVILWVIEDYYYYSACIVIISIVSIIIEIREIRSQALTLREMSSNTGQCNLILPKDDKQSTRGQQNEIEEKEDQNKKDYPHIKMLKVDFDNLVPGDIIEIPRNDQLKQVPADCLLIAGNVIMNESSLTGESVPVSKSAFNFPFSQLNEKLDISGQSKHLLYAGTELVRTNNFEGEVAMAYVLRTGFMTARGQMIRSMLHPKPIDSMFYKDAFRFVGMMSIIAIAGTIFSIYDLLVAGDPVFDAIVTGLDVITICVPPALPSALTIGIHYAVSRLKKRGIFCISPPRVNLAGQIDVFCFDKTGTLTEEGLDIYGILPVKQKSNMEISSENNFIDIVTEPMDSFDMENPLSVGLATCHSLVVLDGEVRGDPIEVKMFESIGWRIVDSKAAFESGGALMSVRPPASNRARSFLIEANEYINYEVGILRELPFSSHMQRMSVIVKRVGCPCPTVHYMELFCKGAPEVVANLCVPNSVPTDFQERLRSYTNQGFRVLALAFKDLGAKAKYHKVLKLERAVLEQDMTFLGLLILQNKLKAETCLAIDTLTRNKIKSIMITGDNLETAVSVASACGIVFSGMTLLSVDVEELPETTSIISPPLSLDVSDSFQKQTKCKLVFHDVSTNTSVSELEYQKLDKKGNVVFAVTGPSYTKLRENFPPDLLQFFATKCFVYSRMKPDQKTQVVKSVQDLGYVVGMCGDGSNDCSALKAAHVGVALSQADASVASPFTSKIENISCVEMVIQEGRCALVTSFSLFKFMMLYSAVQYCSVQLLTFITYNMSDTQQMYEDMVLITILALLMGRTGPLNKLVPTKPENRLMSFSVVFSVVSCTLIQTGTQVAAFFYIRQMPWYTAKIPNAKTTGGNSNVLITGYENTIVFLISNFQYVYSAIVFSKAAPYRKPFYTNRWFTLSVILLQITNCFLIFYPPDFLLSFFELVKVNSDINFVIVMVELSLANFTLLFFLESVVLGYNLIPRFFKAIFHCNKRKKLAMRNYRNVDLISLSSTVHT